CRPLDAYTRYPLLLIFFCNAHATSEIHPLSLHDALPISRSRVSRCRRTWRCRTGSPSSCRAGNTAPARPCARAPPRRSRARCRRSEEHTSELQSRENLVCRLLLEKKKKTPVYCIRSHVLF